MAWTAATSNRERSCGQWPRFPGKITLEPHTVLLQLSKTYQSPGLHSAQNAHHGGIQAHCEVATGTVLRGCQKLPQRWKRISPGSSTRYGASQPALKNCFRTGI